MKKIREEIMKMFYGHCKKCKGACCNDGADFTVFKDEFNKIKSKNKGIVNLCRNQWGRYGRPKGIGIERIGLNCPCPFVREKGCILDLGDKPLDCITYPIFPIIRYYKDERKEIIGMMVHKSCPFFKSISKDKKLIELIKTLWLKYYINKISNNELKHWFGNKRNYWLDKNIHKITTVPTLIE
jgi:hypothetical protein